MVNAVMDALALLSSLATDLDIMLNDLRSAPSTRVPTATAQQQQQFSSNLQQQQNQQQHQRSLSNQSSSSVSSTIDASEAASSYLQNNAFRNEYCQQQARQRCGKTTPTKEMPITGKLSVNNVTTAISSSHTTVSTTITALSSAHINRQQHVRTSSTLAARIQNNYQSQRTEQKQQKQGQRRLNANCCKLRDSHVATRSNKGGSSSDSSSNSGHNGNGSSIIGNESKAGFARTKSCGDGDGGEEDSTGSGFGGLSNEIRQIQRLPLWSYQQRQLQQPQKLHVQLLQQHQKATKAIATKISSDATRLHSKSIDAVKTEMISSVMMKPIAETTTTITSTATASNVHVVGGFNEYENNKNDNNNNRGVIGHYRHGNSSSSWLQAATSLLRSSNDAQSTAATTNLLSSSSAAISTSQQHHHLQQTKQTQQNQLKSSIETTQTTATATTTTTSTTSGTTTTTSVSSSHAGGAVVANHNKSNNNSNNDNSRRLPFCGLDSIKGSDNNGGLHQQHHRKLQQQHVGSDGDGGGDSVGVGGNTNLCFDLNSVGLIGRSNNTKNNNNNNNNSKEDAIHLDAQSEQFHSLDANESSCCGDGPFEDDMQALLPKCRLSRDELSPSRTSLVSSSDGGILAEGETSSETSRGSDECPPCDLGLVERLMLTHPVWFLPGIQRSGAVHFLQSKEEGNFIVRGSSQQNTMAVSVRLPPDTGPYIEHYLIQSNEGIISLESSRFKFNSIPALIAHYAQCCDELPVQLVLPRALREAKNRQQLSSLALLGQEFWRYPMSCPKQEETEANFLDAKSPNSLTETSGIGTTIFSNSTSSNGVQQNHQHPQQHQQQTQQQQVQQAAASKVFGPANNLIGMFSQAGTPSDTTSSVSSFTNSSGPQQLQQVISPEPMDSVILTMSPVDHLNNQRNAVNGFVPPAKDMSNNANAPSLLSTFKSSTNASQIAPLKPNKSLAENGIRHQRPTPPNTLNLDLRKPPTPPVRWSKPLTPNSPPSTPEGAHPLNGSNNFTVTTTVTFSVDNKNSPQFVEVTTPSNSNALNSGIMNSNTATFQTFSKRLSPEGECKDTLSSQGSSSGSRWHTHSSKDSNNSQRHILSPLSAGTPSGITVNKSRKSKARKESKHYQESDILESPQIYCQSSLMDKFSDYEDLWTHDPGERTGLLTSFKPHLEGVQGKRPDLLAETPSITSLNCNVLPPASCSVSSASPPNASDTTATPTTDLTANTPPPSQMDAEHTQQPRSRAAILFPNLMSQSLNEEQLKSTSEGDTTPTALTPISRSKQGSPFYAEPADALRQAGITASILRRSHRGGLLPANHRHSEPPKGGIMRTPLCGIMLPMEIERIAGSLDELKKKPAQIQNQQQYPQEQQQQQEQSQQQQPHQCYQQQPSKRARGRFEQWQLDSSWEFMGKQGGGGDLDDNEDEDGDYESTEHWHSQTQTSHENGNLTAAHDSHKDQKEKPITIHQIIAKRLPDLNLPELVRCSTPPQQQQLQQQQNQQQQQHNHHQQQQLHGQNDSQKCIDSQTGCRLSSYDNVERNLSFFNGIDSSQSDDGTVFSEPWDSSQWDSFLPHDDVTLTSDSIHLSKCRPVVSEDDTIIEELSTKEANMDTLKARKIHGRQKVATILRNPSIRDREILCHPRNKINPYGSSSGPGDSVRAYTLQLAHDQSSTFARNIENFISCTKESREAAPQVVMRNMRQFMNGMKNYLVKHGEGKFQQEVETARSHLKADEFLNLDAILETVMHQLVVLPLREHLYGMFVDYYTRSEDIQLLAQNVKYACGRNAADFGIRNSVTPPASGSLHVISNLLLRLQEAELPLEKLDLFLCVISTIFDATGCPRGQQLGADDFLPILVYVVAKCGFVGAEIEAEFMWGLLQPTLLNGEPGYYLTALCSAVHVLKSFMASENENGTGSLDWRASSLPACSSVLRVIIPDECNGSLQTRTLPVRPHTTTREVCRIIAHKARITNPQDYALFKLIDGEETPLNESECPQDIRLAAKGKHCMLAYKRIDAKIAWPTTTQPIYN